MARRGTWQLEKLVMNYCDHSGSSAGAREFVQRYLGEFKKDNPHVQVDAVVRRGRHPWVEGEYSELRRRRRRRRLFFGWVYCCCIIVCDATFFMTMLGSNLTMYAYSQT